jgi:uncharacterized protein (DUF58 family)
VSAAADLRAAAEGLTGGLPPLLAEAEHLALTVILGEHGRRRVGLGDEFWQYRPSRAGDEARMIDWRRSARSDGHFVREKEWQAAQTVEVWVDRARSMDFASRPDLPTKEHRARVLALAVAVLLNRGGERVGLTDHDVPPRSGRVQMLRLADALTRATDTGDYGAPVLRGMPAHARAMLVSDFLARFDEVEAQVLEAADHGIKGVMLQVLDPAEEAFPFDGRTVFESVGGTLRHETLKASDLKGRYLARLAERKDRLAQLARLTGWQYLTHHTDTSPQAALLWVFGALERRR